LVKEIQLHCAGSLDKAIQVAGSGVTQLLKLQPDEEPVLPPLPPEPVPTESDDGQPETQVKAMGAGLVLPTTTDTETGLKAYWQPHSSRPSGKLDAESQHEGPFSEHSPHCHRCSFITDSHPFEMSESSQPSTRSLELIYS
jgi:hypothetical protein